jgi:hypothetical protein
MRVKKQPISIFEYGAVQVTDRELPLRTTLRATPQCAPSSRAAGRSYGAT